MRLRYLRTLSFCVVLCVGTAKAIPAPQSNYPQSFGGQAGAGGCPERNGRFPDPGQCDAYTECIDGIATRKLCPDGLLFNRNASFFGYPCNYPQEVDCDSRTSFQPAQATSDCPHQFGYYRLGDENNCGQFMMCAHGRAYVFDCPEGLAYNEKLLRCDWPDEVTSCNAEAYLGFSCPNPATSYTINGYAYFRSPNTCDKYFLCINGRPRMFRCGRGKAFNELISACDGAENVTGCAVPTLDSVAQSTHVSSVSVPAPATLTSVPSSLVQTALTTPLSGSPVPAIDIDPAMEIPRFFGSSRFDD